MTAEAGVMLVTEILPIIRGAIAKGAVKTVGSEDTEELVQDTVASAAGMLDAVERAGKKASPSNIAFYAIQSSKSGRRHGNAGRTDVMAPATILDKRSAVQSTEEPVAGSEDDSGFSVSDTLACVCEDPANEAARNLDWAEFTAGLDDRRFSIVQALSEGTAPSKLANELRVSRLRVTQLKHSVAADIRNAWGEDVLSELFRVPGWRKDLDGQRERFLCRAERAA